MSDKEKRSKIIRVITLIVFIMISIAAFTFSYLKFKEEGSETLRELVISYGPLGVLFMLGVQILQVIFAIIPGEPIELVMGALYGTFGGLLLCLAGVAVGSSVIFLLVKLWGRGFIDTFTDSEKFTKLRFLKDAKKRDILVFLLMFIPGTPKDLLTYFAPFTGIGIPRFLIISVIARIPSIITSTYVGSTFAKGEILYSVIVFAIVGVISILGILIYNKIVDKRSAECGKEEDNENSQQN